MGWSTAQGIVVGLLCGLFVAIGVVAVLMPYGGWKRNR